MGGEYGVRQGGGEEPPCPGHGVISGEKSLWACGQGLKEWREELEEESVNTQIKVAFKSITNTCML